MNQIHTLSTHSHAEAALAAGGDLHVAHDIGVVESLIERGAGLLGGVGHLVGNGARGLLTGGGGLEEAGGGAGEGEEEDRDEGTCHFLFDNTFEREVMMNDVGRDVSEQRLWRVDFAL